MINLYNCIGFTKLIIILYKIIPYLEKVIVPFNCQLYHIGLLTKDSIFVSSIYIK